MSPVRSLYLVPVALTACSAPAYEPACIASGELHLCSNVGSHACTLMFVQSGLFVSFTGGSLDRYDATVVVDDRTTTFTCDVDDVQSLTGQRVPMCAPVGFLLEDRGDHVTISVSSADQTFSTELDPCWDVSEPNGRCCGFHYDATVELPVASAP